MRNPQKENIKNRFIDLLSHLRQSSHLKDEIYSVIRYHGAVHSCALENETVPPWFLFNFNGYDYDRKWDKLLPEYYKMKLETISLLESYNHLLILADTKTQITPEHLLDIHHSIFERSRYNHAGKFRNEDNGQKFNGTPLPRFSFVPEQTEQNLTWLGERMKYIGAVSSDNFFEIIHLAAEIQLRLTASQPFSCGNGITARLISDYVMIASGMFNPVYEFGFKDDYKQAIRNSSFENSSALADFIILSFERTFNHIEPFYRLSEKTAVIPKI